MRNTVGIPVQGSNFLKREPESRELWHKATRGHVLMLAPRRVGKTSLLYHLRDAPLDGWRCLFISVESLKGEAQFVARFLNEISQAHPGGAWLQRFGVSLRKLLRGGHASVGPIQVKLATEIGSDWQEVGATALSVLRELQGKTLVLVDEFPIFVRRLLADPAGGERTQLFLDWFREIRNASFREGVETYFLLTGSLGLDAVVRTVGMASTINDLASFRLGPLSEKQAWTLIEELAKGEKLPVSPKVQKRILEKISWRTPFHMQLIFSEILTLVKFRNRELTEDLVDVAYEKLLAAESRKHFDHWAERLEEPLQNPKERDMKKKLLEAAARDSEGISTSTILQIREQYAAGLNEQEALADLEYDGYLTLDGEKWRFSSSLLRSWWLKWQVRI